MLFLSQQNMLLHVQNSPTQDVKLSGEILFKTTEYILAGN